MPTRTWSAIPAACRRRSRPSRRSMLGSAGSPRRIRKAGGALLVTADHGNCEMMRDPVTGGPHTSHTTGPVPLLLMGGGEVALADGRLADLAPTLLALMGLPKPAQMAGVSLLRPVAAAKAGTGAITATRD